MHFGDPIIGELVKEGRIKRTVGKQGELIDEGMMGGWQ
jgi:hypothetical protein